MSEPTHISGLAKMELASNPVTFEYSRSQVMQAVLFIIFTLELFAGVFIIIVGSIACSYCPESHYASYAPVSGSVFFALCVASVTSSLRDNRLCSAMFCLACLVVAAFLLFEQALAYECGKRAALAEQHRDHDQSAGQTCRRFRAFDNLCSPQQLETGAASRRRKIAVFQNNVHGDAAKNDSNTTVAKNEQQQLPPINLAAFQSGRLALLFAAMLAVFFSLCTGVVMGMAEQATGKPVFLYKKRTPDSYVVGDIINVQMAFENEEKNSTVTRPTKDEWQIYDQKRAKFGGKKLVTSTLTSVTSFSS